MDICITNIIKILILHHKQFHYQHNIHHHDHTINSLTKTASVSILNEKLLAYNHHIKWLQQVSSRGKSGYH